MFWHKTSKRLPKNDRYILAKYVMKDYKGNLQVRKLPMFRAGIFWHYTDKVLYRYDAPQYWRYLSRAKSRAIKAKVLSETHSE